MEEFDKVLKELGVVDVYELKSDVVGVREFLVTFPRDENVLYKFWELQSRLWEKVEFVGQGTLLYPETRIVRVTMTFIYRTNLGGAG